MIEAIDLSTAGDVNDVNRLMAELGSWHCAHPDVQPASGGMHWHVKLLRQPNPYKPTCLLTAESARSWEIYGNP